MTSPDKLQTVVTDSAEEAAAFIRSGGLTAFPTETVYGLGANVFDAGAVAAIFAAKNRPADNPLIVHVARIDQIRELAAEITDAAQRLIEAFFPGPLTVVLRRSARVPDIATARLDSIGIRMPRHPLAHEFLTACDTPVAAPSANISGRPSPTTWQAVLEDLDGRIDCILKGEATEIGLESTVVDCLGDMPILLRQGAISVEELRTVSPMLRMADTASDGAVRSPGLRHRHYSPRASIIIVTDVDGDTREPSTAFIGVSRVDKDRFDAVRICDSVEHYARSVFEFFRECDRRGIQTILCEAVPPSGIGAALMDRLRRAAEK